MPQQLTKMKLDEISLVDRGADADAMIVLSKRDDDTCKGDVCKAPSGVQFNIGFPKDGGGSEVQSVVFDSEKWDEEKAKAWLKEHDMSSGKMDQTKNTLRFRQKEPDGYSRFRMITPGEQVSKALKAKDSWSNVQRIIDSALRKEFEELDSNGGIPTSYVYVRDLFKDSAIFEQDGKLYRVDYKLDYEGEDDPAVTFGEKIPQRVVYQDVQKAEEATSEVPAELLFKLGRLEAQAGLLAHRVNKIRPIKVRKYNKNHDASTGRFTSGSGGGGSAKTFSSGNESFDLQTTGEGRNTLKMMSSQKGWDRSVGANTAVFDTRRGTQAHQVKIDPHGEWQHKMWTGGRGSGRVLGKGKGRKSLERSLDRQRM